MRILHLDTGATWRGGQQQVSWLMEGLRELGEGQRLVAPAASALGAAMQKKGFEVTTLRGAGVSLGNIMTVRRAARNYDIVHAHDARGHTLAWLSGCAAGSRSWPHLVVSRRVGFPIGRFGSFKYASADAYIAVSDYCRQQLSKVGVDAKKIHVVFDGVALPSPSAPAERAEFRGRFGPRDSSNRMQVIGSLTSIAPEKLLREEIDLLAQLPATVHLWIGRPAGPDADEDELSLIEYARDRGVLQRFRVLPLIGDLGGFFASLDVFLYLSKSEGLGSAILLAMAYGLPVVVSRVGGVPEIVRDRETGCLIDGEDSPGLSNAVRALLESGELRHKLGAAARTFVSENATTQMMVSKTRAVYDKLLQPVAGDSRRSIAKPPRSGEREAQADRMTGGTA